MLFKNITISLIFLFANFSLAYSQDGMIRRANLDGSNIEIIQENLSTPTKVELDISNSKIYWSERGSSNKIKRSNIDGSMIETLVDNGQSPRDIQINFTDSKLFWTEDSDVMRKADIDGSNIEVVTTEFASSADFGIDEANSKIYVGDSGLDNIRRFDQDGTNIEELVFAQTPRGLDLDLNNNKIYWIDNSFIKKSDLDGSNAETIYTDPDNDNLGDIELDVPNNKLYFTNLTIDNILRANLDGSNVETIITDINAGPGGIDLDLTNNKIYWTQNGDSPLSVQLSEFNARASSIKNQVDLSWKTVSELNNEGFVIQRSHDGFSWEYVQFIFGHGTTNEVNEYSFTDIHPLPGDNYYRLKQIDFDGKSDYSDIEHVQFTLEDTKLMRIFPNPSNGHFSLNIYNPDQRRAVFRLFDSTSLLIWESRFSEGEMPEVWQQQFDLPQREVYFVTTQIGDQFESKKISIIDKR